MDRATRRSLPARLAALLAALALLAPAAAPAQSKPPAFKDETFLYAMPGPGWRLAFQQTTERRSVREFVPEGESAERWGRMLTIQVFFRDKRSLAQWTEDMVKMGVAGACERGAVVPQQRVKAQVFEAQYLYIVCPRNLLSGEGEFAVAKGIRGQDAIYVAQLSWRGPAFEWGVNPVPRPEFAAWSDYLGRRVLICDPRRPELPCPAAPGPGG